MWFFKLWGCNKFSLDVKEVFFWQLDSLWIFPLILLKFIFKLHLKLSYILGKHSDDKDEDLKGQISKGVANYVRGYINLVSSVFSALYYASMVYAVTRCLSVCMLRAKVQSKWLNRITQLVSYDSPESQLLWCQRSERNSNGVTPSRPTNTHGVNKYVTECQNFSIYTAYTDETKLSRSVVSCLAPFIMTNIWGPFYCILAIWER